MAATLTQPPPVAHPKRTTSPCRYSVIIPALDEEDHIASAIRSAQSDPREEVIVADGGSRDHTVAIAQALDARVVHSPRGRAVQMNAGARVARGEVLIFLHADSRLPPDYARCVERIVCARDAVAGAFELAIDSTRRSLRLHAAVANVRSRWLNLPYGDQALFLRREIFARVGGFAPLPIMEDVELLQRLARFGRIFIANRAVRTSDRRWRKVGPLRTFLLNQLILLGWRLGIDPVKLSHWRESGKIHPPSYQIRG